jgi:hypothetical protein
MCLFRLGYPGPQAVAIIWVLYRVLAGTNPTGLQVAFLGRQRRASTGWKPLCFVCHLPGIPGVVSQSMG